MLAFAVYEGVNEGTRYTCLGVLRVLVRLKYPCTMGIKERGRGILLSWRGDGRVPSSDAKDRRWMKLVVGVRRRVLTYVIHDAPGGYYSGLGLLGPAARFSKRRKLRNSVRSSHEPKCQPRDH